MDETVAVTLYASEGQKDSWQEEAEQRGLSLSKFGINALEAHTKEFEPIVDRLQSTAELYDRIRELTSELDEKEAAIEALEGEADNSVAEVIVEVVEANPGVGYQQLMQTVLQELTDRVNDALDQEVGDRLMVKDGRYYLTGGGDSDGD
jgi:hypothetical protein